MVLTLQLVASPSPFRSLPIPVATATPVVLRIGGRRCHRNLNSNTSITFSGLGSTVHDSVAISLTNGSTVKRKSSFRCSAVLSPELKTTLDKVVTSQKVILFMKGTRDFPQCGFSNTVVQILKSLNVPFETINILENEILRQGLKEYSSWPTFPQLYIDGEFFGGCDITVEAFQSGELQEVVEKAICS